MLLLAWVFMNVYSRPMAALRAGRVMTTLLLPVLAVTVLCVALTVRVLAVWLVRTFAKDAPRKIVAVFAAGKDAKPI